MAKHTEASRNIKKRTKRSEYNIRDVEESEEDESLEGGLNATEPSHATPSENNVEDPRPMKKKRGKTKLKGLGLEHHEPAEVEFNEKGQPIGDASVKLSSFLGTLVRSVAPLNEKKGWRHVDPQLKENLWKIVLQRYKLEEEDKDNILQRMGKVLREYRSRLSTDMRKACELEEEQKKTTLAELKPQNLTDREWEEFIATACSVKAKNKCSLMKIIRKNYTEHHRMSRRGYARLEAKLKKEDPNREVDRVLLWVEAHLNKDRKPANSSIEKVMNKMQVFNEKHPGAQGSSLENDALTDALGKDRTCMVKGLGFGVTLPKLKAQAHATKENRKLQEEVSDLRAMVKKLIAEKESTSLPQRVNTPQVGTLESHGNSNSLSSDVHEPAIGTKCKLMSWYKKGEVVAEGTISSTDPNTKVHCEFLGFDAWKVWVDNPLVPDAKLWRATLDANTIENAKDTPVAWSKTLISWETT